MEKTRRISLTGLAAGLIAAIALSACGASSSGSQSAASLAPIAAATTSAADAPATTDVPATTEAAATEAATTTEAASPVATEQNSAATAAAQSQSSSVDFILKDYTGEDLQYAQNDVQTHGIFYSKSHDATSAGRHQIFDHDWMICSQSPAAGTHITSDEEGVINFAAVKKTETCP